MAEGRVAFAGTQSEAESMWRTLGNPAPDNFNPSDHYISSLAVVKKKNPLSSVMVRNLIQFCLFSFADAPLKL